MPDVTSVDGMPAARPRIDRLTTFDCFDTVITRAVGSPDAVGYVTGLRLHREGLVPVGPERYAAARAEAEELMWRRRGDEGTLADIATELAELLNLPPGHATLLAEAEVSVERELSREVPGARARLEQARADSSVVGFLSDTPLPHDVVADLLARHDLRGPADLLWVSNELGASKGRGTGYPAVVRRLGAAPTTWVHLGDNALADIRNARLCGITPVHLPAGRLTRYETSLERHRIPSGGLTSVMAGASRRTRLLLAADRPDVPAGLAGVAAGVAGPLLAGYVLWCLLQAEAAGVRRLYFVARGGEVLLDMARHLVAALDIDVELRYLYGSRKAWMLPSTPAERRDFLLAVGGREDHVSVRSTLSWFSVTPDRIAGPLVAAGFPAETWVDPLDQAGFERLAAVVEDPEADAVLAAETDRRSDAAGAFLRAEGLLDDIPFGIVEMTGRGTTGRFLTDALTRFGGRAATVELYFGLEEEVADTAGRTLRAYMFDDKRGVGLSRRDTDLWVPLESFTQARHGHTSHYEEREGRVVPVLGPDPQALAAWGLDGFRDALDVYSVELASSLRHVDPRGDARRATWEVLRTFWLHPTAAELAVWKAFPVEDDMGTYPMGQGYSARQVLSTVIARKPRVRARGTWPAGVRLTAPAGLRLARGAAALVAGGLRSARRLSAFVRHSRVVRAGR